MQLRSYSVFDNKALCYHAPFFAATDGAAIRSFQELANDLNTTVGRHPGDYSLWCVGTFDDSNGVFHPVLPLIHVSDAIALVARQPSLQLDAAQVTSKE